MADEFKAIAEGLASIKRASDRLEGLDALTEQMKRMADHKTAGALPASLEPDKAYGYEEASEFIGMKPQSVRAISKTELPRVRRGAVLGVDIMAYLGEITYDEAAAYKEARRQRVIRHISDAA